MKRHWNLAGITAVLRARHRNSLGEECNNNGFTLLHVDMGILRTGIPHLGGVLLREDGQGFPLLTAFLLEGITRLLLEGLRTF